MSMSNHDYDCGALGCDYHTSDLAFATALVSLGYNLAVVHPENPKRMQFGFEGSFSAEELQRRYYAKSLMVDAMTYSQSMRLLKNQMYSGRL